MAKGFHQTIILGNLGSDVEVRHTASGMPVGNVNIAVTESRKVGDGYEDQTTWYRTTLWGKTAENAAKYLGKGSQVQVIGRMQERKYNDKDGNERRSWELTCDRLIFVGGRQDGGGQRQQSGGNNWTSGGQRGGQQQQKQWGGNSNGGNGDNWNGGGQQQKQPAQDPIPF